MHVGAYYLRLTVYNSRCLKDKRKVVKSIIQRVRQRYNVSVSEIGSCDEWMEAELGIAAVSGDSRGTDRVLQGAFKFVDEDDRVEVVDYTFRSV